MTGRILIFLLFVTLFFAPIETGNSSNFEIVQTVPVVHSQPAKSGNLRAVRATAYTNIPKCTDKTPDTTASNLKLHKQKHHKKVIALSRDLARQHKFGDLFEVTTGSETFIAEFQDVMAKRKKNSVDVYMSNLRDCREWGVKSVKITKLCK